MQYKQSQNNLMQNDHILILALDYLSDAGPTHPKDKQSDQSGGEE